MDETRRRFLGLVYLVIGSLSLFYGLYWTSAGYGVRQSIPDDYVVFTVPAFCLTAITFFFAARCFSRSRRKLL